MLSYQVTPQNLMLRKNIVTLHESTLMKNKKTKINFLLF